MNLTEIQVILIENDLKSRGLKYAPLQDELIDHVCCLIEDQMSRGISFEEARLEVLQSIPSSHLKAWQQATKQVLNKKEIIMKRISFATAGIAAGFILFTTVTNAQQLPDTPPLDMVEITSGFGLRMHPIKKQEMLHMGIDLKASTGTPVRATADGTVLQVAEDPKGYGKYIVIDHGANLFTKYAQLSGFRVQPGEKVTRGQVIGLVGNSGASTAPHLHYEVIKDQQPVNPQDYMSKDTE